MSAKEAIEQLRLEIQKHNDLYYKNNAPIISDQEYDALVRRLKTLEQKYPQFSSNQSNLFQSPSQIVGSDLQDGFKKVKHSIEMLSLTNTYNEDEIKDFDRKVRTSLGEKIDYVAELKIDGCSVSLVYKNWKLDHAVTRGDGEEGDDVTENVKTIKSIPKEVDHQYPKDFEVRGEIFMKFSDFEQLNIRMKLEGKLLFSNPRNTASGSLKLLDSKEVTKRPLSIFCYYLLGAKVGTQFASLKKLDEMGFPVNRISTICTSVYEIWDFRNIVLSKRTILDYPIDGIVIKINKKDFYKRIGNTSNAPRWAIAYKFPAEKVITKLNDIIVQVGISGYITPVAELQMVNIQGSNIKRASLHNEEEVARLDVRIGDYVYVEKAADVIPKVSGVDFTKRNPGLKKWKMITHCPVCGTKLIKEEVKSKCPNSKGCRTQVLGRIRSFIGKGALDAENIGEARIEQLFDVGYIKDPGDLYSVTESQLRTLSNIGDRSIEIFFEALENTKNQPLRKLIAGLCIPGVGGGSSKKLEKEFQTLDNLAKATTSQIESILGLGNLVSNAVVSYFKDNNNLVIIEKLRKAGLNFGKIQIVSNTKGKFSGMNICVTGSLKNYSRTSIQDCIEKNGGEFSGVSKKTVFLLVGKNPGSKLQKAQSLGIKIINEEEFEKLIS